MKNTFEIKQPLYLIFKDLENIFEYIEPCDDNLNVYSHRLYELYLRACTEFEYNCKSILIEEKYKGSETSWKIEDYYTVNLKHKLTKYSVKIDIWPEQPKILKPFCDWCNTKKYQKLEWYSDYNKVKHNRNTKFHKANLENLVNSVGGLYIVIYARIGTEVFARYQESQGYTCDEDDYQYGISSNVPFGIKPPSNS